MPNKQYQLLLFASSLLITSQLSSDAQSAPKKNSTICLRAVYQLDFKIDSAVTTPKRVRTILRVSNGTSRFESTGTYLRDSVYASLKGVAEQERIQRSFNATRKGGKNDFQYTIIKEPAKNLVAYHDNINSEDYQYQEKQSLFAWRITSAKKTIAGHECQQAYTAFGGRMWEAWFARDVPVSYGPYKFYGLPGLILQVRDTHDHWVFSLLCLDTNPQPFDAAIDIDTPFAIKSSAPIISKAKFLQAKHNDEVTFLERVIAVGNKVPESLRQNHLQTIARRNNPLELR